MGHDAAIHAENEAARMHPEPDVNKGTVPTGAEWNSSLLQNDPDFDFGDMDFSTFDMVYFGIIGYEMLENIWAVFHNQSNLNWSGKFREIFQTQW